MISADASSLAERLYRGVLNPWVVVACLAAGILFGLGAPSAARSLSVVGVVYVALLKLIVLPLMVSAVIFSVQRLFREGGAGKVLPRLTWVFAAFALIAALVGVLGTYALNPGSELSPATRGALAQMVGSDIGQSNTDITLRSDAVEARPTPVRDVLASLIPSNIFASLAQGDALKALVFALLFGYAIGHVPARVSENLTSVLETTYQACQTLAKWLCYPVPLVLFAMTASQMATTGFGPIMAMGGFVATFLLAAVVWVALAVALIRARSGQSWSQVLYALRAPFALAMATRSSATCMPAMIEALVTHLSFSRARVELLVPLSVSLLRLGPTLYYVAATLFMAQLYGRALTTPELGLVVLMAVLAGFASSGLGGVATLSLLGTTSGYLGLPVEAALILFVAVDPICDLARTVVTVIGNSAAVAAVCPKPLAL